MNRSILAFCGASEGVVADLLLVTVHCTDEGQGLGHRLGLAVFCAFKAASRMGPALRMDDLPGAGARIGCIPFVAVSQQGAAELAQEAAHMAVFA